MLKLDQSCLFAAPMIADCSRDIAAPAATLAQSWPMAIGLLLIVGLAGYAYLRTIYPHEINWEQEPDEPAPLPPIETVSRDAGA
jgi:hypothetical protein